MLTASRLATRSEIKLGLLKEITLRDVDMVKNFFGVVKSEKYLGVPALKLWEYRKSKKDSLPV
jgi:glutaredoxin-related protein